MSRLLASLDRLRRDGRHAVRALARSPLFTATAVLTLAVGLGANTAVFSVVDALLLRPLPYPEPERLAVVSVTVRSDEGERPRAYHTGRTWEILRDGARDVDLAVFSSGWGGVNLFADGEAAYVQQQRVGAGFFRVLGVAPALGRGFTEDEDVRGGPRVVALAHDLWRRTFDADPGILGREVLLKGEPHTVVGVMPEGFRSTADADLWTPLRATTSGEGSGTNFGILARPEPGVSLAAAEAEVAALGDRAWEEQLRGDEEVTATFGLRPLADFLTAGLESQLLILWGAAGLVLLVVCTNLASLVLARWGGRRREIAARMALGSGRAGVVHQVLVESLLLAGAGAVVGTLLGLVGLHLLLDLAREALGIWQPVGLDVRAVVATVVLAAAAGVLFGLGPALQVSRTDLTRALSTGAVGTLSTGTAAWSRRLLVVGEVAVGVVLVVFAGLLVRSFAELRTLEPGFDPRGVVTGTASLQDARYDTRDEVIALFRDTLDHLDAVPGVESAAVGLGLPFQRPLNLPFSVVGGGARSSEVTAVSARYVTPSYFETLRIPLLRGRAFRATDGPEGLPVAVVNRAFVERYLESADPALPPLGTSLHLPSTDEERQIVGVVDDVLVSPRGLGGVAPLDRVPLLYLPAAQLGDDVLTLVHTWFRPSWVVRSRLPASAATGHLRAAVRAADPRLPLVSLHEMGEVERGALGVQRFLMVLVTALATVALLLAAVGLYALVANSVTDRRRELGIRMALGATRAQVLRSVVVPGVALAAVGAAVGTAAALPAARLLRAQLFAVSPGDPWSLAGGALLLIAVAAAASLFPGLRALRLDPARTLRQE